LLAIDPGTRELGVAIFEEGQLLVYQVVNLKRRRPVSALLRTTQRLLERWVELYRINQIVLEFVPPLRPAPLRLLVAQVRMIRRWAKQHTLPLVEFAAQTVRKHLVQNSRATKRETAKVVVHRFPELGIYLNQTYKSKDAYWQNLFDAVALGLTYLDQRSCGRAIHPNRLKEQHCQTPIVIPHD